MLIDLDLGIKYFQPKGCLADRADSGKTGVCLFQPDYKDSPGRLLPSARSLSALTDEIAYFHQLGHHVSTVEPVFQPPRILEISATILPNPRSRLEL